MDGATAEVTSIPRRMPVRAITVVASAAPVETVGAATALEGAVRADLVVRDVD
jgi:hypothetical protein